MEKELQVSYWQHKWNGLKSEFAKQRLSWALLVLLGVGIWYVGYGLINLRDLMLSVFYPVTGFILFAVLRRAMVRWLDFSAVARGDEDHFGYDWSQAPELVRAAIVLGVFILWAATVLAVSLAVAG